MIFLNYFITLIILLFQVYTSMSKLCRNTIKTGTNIGKDCNRENCKIHCNIADYLNLSDYYSEVVEHHKHFFPKDHFMYIINTIEECSDIIVDKKEHKFIDIVKKFIADFGNIYGMNSRDIKIIYFTYFLKIMDTRYMNYHLHNKNVSRSGFLIELNKKVIKMKEINPYIDNLFEINRKYFSKEKNRKYIFTLIKTSIIFTNFYFKTLEKTYAPGGQYAIDCEKRYNEMVEIRNV